MVRARGRFRNRGAEHVRESGTQWMSGRATRQCGRALSSPG
jgi:hypothetical protein